MEEPALGIAGRDGLSWGSHSEPESPDGASPQAPKHALELAPSELNGVQVGAVGRHVQHVGAGGLDGVANTGRVMSAEVVHHDRVASPEDGNQMLVDEAEEDRARGSALDSSSPRALPG